MLPNIAWSGNSRNPMFAVISDDINYSTGLKYVEGDIGIFEENEYCISVRRENDRYISPPLEISNIRSSMYRESVIEIKIKKISEMK